jgi:hypothetical protein
VKRNLKERIALMEQQLRALRGRHHEVEATRKREAARQAKIDETRRQILLGKCTMERVSRGELAEAQLQAWLKAGLSDPADLELFGIDSGPDKDQAHRRL